MIAAKIGFLVVEVPAREGAYRGIGRVPPHHLDDRGPYGDAMNDYVFDPKYIDPSTHLIPSFRAAVGLADRLSQTSGRAFEVIRCAVDSEESQMSAASVRRDDLGFDVAGLQGYWSIVEDFAISPWARAFHDLLNENGLFRSRSDAEAYLESYRREREADYDEPFEIVQVARCWP